MKIKMQKDKLMALCCVLLCFDRMVELELAVSKDPAGREASKPASASYVHRCPL
jgi:hypothetical protein